MRSVVVVLPASTCAMMPMLRVSARGVVRAIAKFRLDSEGWVGETPDPGVFRGADGSEKRGGLLEELRENSSREKNQDFQWLVSYALGDRNVVTSSSVVAFLPSSFLGVLR